MRLYEIDQQNQNEKDERVIDFIKNRYGGTHLVFDGFTYTRKKCTPKNTYWRCTEQVPLG